MVNIWATVISSKNKLEKWHWKNRWKAHHLNEDGKHVGIPKLELCVTAWTHYNATHITQKYYLNWKFDIFMCLFSRLKLNQICQTFPQSIFLDEKVPNIQKDNHIFSILQKFIRIIKFLGNKSPIYRKLILSSPSSTSTFSITTHEFGHLDISF